MSKSLIRQLTLFSYIEDKNKNGENPSKENIISYIDSTFGYKYSKSTFYRDLDFIKLNLNETLVEDNGWKFETLGTTSNFFQNLNRNLVILSAFKETNKNLNNLKNIIFDSQESTGADYFKQILDACEKNQEIEFEYFYYDKQVTKKKTFQPYVLKEKTHKWYILGYDTENPEFYKSFALERISNFNNTKRKFEKIPTDFETSYKDAFGMFTNKEPVKVVLQFDERDGNYLKSKPIHHSQKIKNLENGVEIELFIKPTLDFIMELMSRSWSLKIIKPQTLKDEIMKYWKEAIVRNS